MKKASIIIASWNRKKDTLETLKSLALSKLNNVRLEVITVDNGSTDNSAEAIRAYISKAKKENITWKLIVNEKNTGFCEGNNIGMRYALKRDADYVILLNDDVIVDRDLIGRLVECAIINPDAGAITPKIYFAKGYEFHKERYKKNELGKVIWYAGGDIDWNNIYGTNHGVDEVDRGQFDRVREIDFASGCCVLYPSNVLKKVGLLDKKFFAYLEDLDISQRIKKAGYKVLFDPKGILWHKVSQSSGIGSDLNDYFITRNRLIFGYRYASFRTKFALFRESIKFILSGRKWQKIGAKDFYFQNFGKGSWGKK